MLNFENSTRFPSQGGKKSVNETFFPKLNRSLPWNFSKVFYAKTMHADSFPLPPSHDMMTCLTQLLTSSSSSSSSSSPYSDGKNRFFNLQFRVLGIKTKSGSGKYGVVFFLKKYCIIVIISSQTVALPKKDFLENGTICGYPWKISENVPFPFWFTRNCNVFFLEFHMQTRCRKSLLFPHILNHFFRFPSKSV